MNSKQLAVVIAGADIMVFLFGFLLGYPFAKVLLAAIIVSIFCVVCWYFWYEELGISFENYVQRIGEKNMETQKMKGRVIGFFAMAITVAYAIFVFSYFNDLSMETLSDALASAIAKKAVEPHLYLSLAGAALSLFGFFAKNKTCMLIASIAMLCAGLVFTMYFQMIILPAILLFIAFLRMNKTK